MRMYFVKKLSMHIKKVFRLMRNQFLKRYEIRRKSMNLLMLKSMDFFVDLFGIRKPLLKTI